ncbi:MAG: peptide deformylase [Candidatus Harrisonbacteria bacterium]|nr:peptide deformylase [Candidatus Harrisonbacteria bacterium]
MSKIVTTANKKDEKFLRRPTASFDFSKHKKSEIRQLIKDMRTTMQKADGIGLSANQIGLNTKIFVAKVENKFYTLFNPEFIQISKETSDIDEGCLSIPGVFGMVERPAKVTIKGLDANGKTVKIKAWGLLARVFQHEMDHLNGRLFIDRAKTVQKLESRN